MIIVKYVLFIEAGSSGREF